MDQGESSRYASRVRGSYARAGENGGAVSRTAKPSRWFRLYAEFANDPKVQSMSETDQRRFLMLCCLRCSNGDVTLHDGDIAFSLRIENDSWQQTKKIFLEKKLIDKRNRPSSWDKRQFASDSSAERVSKHRAKQKCSGDVTLQKRHANALEAEAEAEADNTSAPDNPADSPAPKKSAGKKPHVVTFSEGQFSGINGFADVWRKAYPAVNIDIEVSKAAAWLVANPKNSKSNYARFLTNWLARAQDKAPAKGGGEANPIFKGMI